MGTNVRQQGGSTVLKFTLILSVIIRLISAIRVPFSKLRQLLKKSLMDLLSQGGHLLLQIGNNAGQLVHIPFVLVTHFRYHHLRLP